MSLMIVAELSGNHGHSLAKARQLVDAARDAGATHLKTQCFDPESLTLDCDRPEFIVQGGLWDGRKLIDLYRETQMPWPMIREVFDYANSLGLKAFSSVFDRASVDYIASLSPAALKIATLELVDTPLIAYAASKGFPMIVSVGMGSNPEIGEAVRAVLDSQVDNALTLLHCPPDYPAKPANANFERMKGLMQMFAPVPVGFSDHSGSVTLPAAAVALGATIIEVHLTLSRADGGADAAFSLEPHQFGIMAKACYEARAALQVPKKVDEPHYGLRRSLYVVADIKAGEAFTADNIRSIRPGNGIRPGNLPMVLGRRATRDLARGTPLTFEHIG